MEKHLTTSLDRQLPDKLKHYTNTQVEQKKMFEEYLKNLLKNN